MNELIWPVAQRIFETPTLVETSKLPSYGPGYFAGRVSIEGTPYQAMVELLDQDEIIAKTESDVSGNFGFQGLDETKTYDIIATDPSGIWEKQVYSKLVPKAKSPPTNLGNLNFRCGESCFSYEPVEIDLDGPVGVAVVTDSTGASWTNEGGLQYTDNAQKFPGRNSLVLAGTGYINLPGLLNFSKKFMIDMWIYPIGLTQNTNENCGLFFLGDAASNNNRIQLYVQGQQLKIHATVSNVTNDTDASGYVYNNRWCHVRFVWYGGTIYYFQDGVLKNSLVTNDGLTGSPPATLIGTSRTSNALQSFKGQICNVKIVPLIGSPSLANFEVPETPDYSVT